VGDGAVEQAGERTQTEEGQAPQSHDPAALPFGDAELESRRGRRVRCQVTEPADEQQREAERQPRAEREGGDAAAEQEQGRGHAPARGGDSAGDNERGRHGPRTEGADDEPGPRVRPAVCVREGRRERVDRVGGEAHDRDDQKERRELGLLAKEPDAVTYPRLLAARPFLPARPHDQQGRDEHGVRHRVERERGGDPEVMHGQRRADGPEYTREVERHRVQRHRGRDLVPSHERDDQRLLRRRREGADDAETQCVGDHDPGGREPRPRQSG